MFHSVRCASEYCSIGVKRQPKKSFCALNPDLTDRVRILQHRVPRGRERAFPSFQPAASATREDNGRCSRPFGADTSAGDVKLCRSVAINPFKGVDVGARFAVEVKLLVSNGRNNQRVLVLCKNGARLASLPLWAPGAAFRLVCARV